MQEIIDQLLHFSWTLMLLLPFVYNKPSVKVFVIVAVLAMLPREFVDQWNGHVGWGKMLDIFFFTLGGLAAGLLWKHQHSTLVNKNNTSVGDVDGIHKIGDATRTRNSQRK